MSHGKLTEVFTGIFGLNDSEYAFLISQYSELHRHYHTLAHIEDCLFKCDIGIEHINDLKSFQIALLYHDIFYDPKRKDNEEKSADYAFKFLNQLHFQNAQKVKDLILLTKHPSVPKTQDEKLLLDIDLSILGEDKNTYEKYEENIRKEYIHVPKVMYKLGRKKLLKKFLAQERLFQTDIFFEKYEEQARVNIEWAINKL